MMHQNFQTSLFKGNSSGLWKREKICEKVPISLKTHKDLKGIAKNIADVKKK